MLNFDMTNWSIARRISVVAYGLMGALAGIALLGLFSTFKISSLFDPYSDASNNAVLAAVISEDLIEAQLAAMVFRSSPSAEIVEEFNGNLEEIRRDSEILTDALQNSPESLDAINSLLDELAAYEAAFKQLQDFRARRDALVSEIATKAPEIRGQLDGALTIATFGGDSRVLTPLELSIKAFDLSRIASERFLMTNDPNDLATAQDHLEKAAGALETATRNSASDRDKENLSGTGENIASYTTALASVASLISERNIVRAEMVSSLEVMDGFAQRVVDSTGADRSSLSAERNRINLIVSTIMIVASIAAGLAGLLLSMKIGKATKDAVDASISNMRDLADGNLDVEIVGAEMESEFGDIARSLVVFRDNARERIEMEERQKAAEAEAARKKADEEKRAAEAEAELAKREEEKRQAMLTELSDSIGGVVEAGANGDFSRRIDVHFDAPELNQMASAINNLVENVETGVKETSRVISLLAAGDLSARMEGDFRGAFESLRNDVNQTFETLGSIAAQLNDQCVEVGNSAEAMLQQADELSRRAEQQAASLEETSAAIEEIANAAGSNAKASAGAAKTAENASSQVESAGEVVSAAVDAMGGIKASSSRISEIVSVIDGIAFQTNLLALNASVEAARAGSAGKGFAVVASEVRGLAQRSGEASKSIKELIDEGANEVEKGVALVEEAGQSLEQIMEGVREMADSMKALTSTAQEQATSITEVSSAITQMDTITQKNAALADQGRGSSAEMGQKSTAMSDLVSWFKLGDQHLGATDIAAE